MEPIQRRRRRKERFSLVTKVGRFYGTGGTHPTTERREMDVEVKEEDVMESDGRSPLTVEKKEEMEEIEAVRDHRGSYRFITARGQFSCVHYKTGCILNVWLSYSSKPVPLEVVMNKMSLLQEALIPRIP